MCYTEHIFLLNYFLNYPHASGDTEKGIQKSNIMGPYEFMFYFLLAVFLFESHLKEIQPWHKAKTADKDDGRQDLDLRLYYIIM